MSLFNVSILNPSQIIVGVDIHNGMPTLVPPVLVPMPHMVVWGVGWSAHGGVPLAAGPSGANKINDQLNSSSSSNPVYGVGAGLGTIAAGHDCGPCIPHLAPNILAPLVTLGASAKSEFGCGSVRTPKGQLAVDISPLIVSPLLSCQELFALPTVMSVQNSCTVQAGFTIRDWLAGLLSMALDMCISKVLGKIAEGAAKGSKLFAEQVISNLRKTVLREAVEVCERFLVSVGANSIDALIVSTNLKEFPEWFFANMIGGPTGGAFPVNLFSGVLELVGTKYDTGAEFVGSGLGAVASLFEPDEDDQLVEIVAQ